jgi:ATP-binding cassette subfamily F protein 3
LEGATLKLLPGHVYALHGREGCGKSTLLRRIHAGKIAGFPPHISSVYIPQEVTADPGKTALEIVLGHHDTYFQRSVEANQAEIEQLEQQIDDLDLSTEEGERKMEALCQHISSLQEEIDGGYDVEVVRNQAETALQFFGIQATFWNVPSDELSAGQRKKMMLSCALFCDSKLLLLDEPNSSLDIEGLLQLRELIAVCRADNRTVLLVSHDVDLINDVATDVIHLFQKTLSYYPGNYRDFKAFKLQNDLHRLRQNAALEKKRDALMSTIRKARCGGRR